MTVRARAKVNLWLRVLAREASGYHQIHSLFCALDLADELTFESAAALQLTVIGADVGPVEQNLVYRAARAFFEATDTDDGVHISLAKHIPAGAGLGGGSSDAAATLDALNRRAGSPLVRTELLRIAARLGSDVPFFLCGSPLALAAGYGERLQPLPPLPSRPVLVLMPPFGSSTAQAYADLDRDREGKPLDFAPDTIEATLTWEAVAARAHNDFEPVIYTRHPELRAARDDLLQAGAGIALLAGSGAAVWGVFEDDEARDIAAAAVARDGWRVERTRTAAR